MKSLEILKQEKSITIKSTELVEIVNEFRKLESEITKGKYTELQHKSFKAKIDKELETLKKLGLDNQQNILPVTYSDAKGEIRPCYELNRDGMLQMLNSESTIVRAKTIEYINQLEDKLKEVASLSREQELVLSIYNGGIEAIEATKELSELKVKEAVKPLNEKIEEDRPFVSLAKKRLDKNGLISITDANKTFERKRGEITKWAKSEGYLHKTNVEVNKKGDEYFRVYDSKGYRCIGVTEKGLVIIDEHFKSAS